MDLVNYLSSAFLTQAVDLLDLTSAPFAPRELTRSSRHRLVAQMRKTWNL